MPISNNLVRSREILHPEYKELFHKSAIFLICVLCIAAPAYYFHLVGENAVNVPVWDDYHTLIQFMNDFLNTETFRDKISLVFVQHIEHRLIFLHLVTISVFNLMGELDFKILCYIGNAALVVLALFFFYAFKGERAFKLFYFSPVLFFLFQPQYYDVILWQTALFSYFSVLIFALITLVLIVRRSRSAFVLASIFAVLTISCQGNGALIFPLGLFILILQKSYKRGAVWTLISAVSLGIYFINYTQIPGNPGIVNAFLNFKDTALYVFCFIGSAPGFSLFYPSLFFGIGIVLYFIFLTATKYYKDNLVFYSFFLFVFLTIGINALFRSWKGLEFALTQSRYKFISVSLVILVYLSLYEKIRHKRFHFYVALTGLIVAMTFFFLSVNLFTPKVVGNSELLRRGMLRWHVEEKGLNFPVEKSVNRILNESIKKSVYKYPEDIFQKFLQTPHDFRIGPISGVVRAFIDIIAENDAYIYIDGWAFLKTEEKQEEMTWLVLKSAEHTFAVPTVAIRRPDLVAAFSSRHLSKSGFGVLVSKEMIPPGRYEVGAYTKVRSKDKDDNGLWFSGRFIEIKTDVDR